jgi:hypothetical protein
MRIIEIIAVVVLILVLLMIGLDFVEILIWLIFGWIFFISDVFPHVTFNGGALGVLTVLVLAVGVHLFMAWFYENYGAGEVKRRWRLRWTLTGLSIFIVMFVTSIAVTGFLHQLAWLWDEPFLKSSSDKRMTSHYMEDIGTALRSYQAEHGRFPKSTGTVDLQELGIYNGPYKDRWGTAFQYTSGGESYILRSYGPNRILGGGRGEFDDLVYSNGQFIAGVGARTMPLN